MSAVLMPARKRAATTSSVARATAPQALHLAGRQNFDHAEHRARAARTPSNTVSVSPPSPSIRYARRMSLDQIHAFVAVAEEGSVRRASVRLHISQPPLPRRIRDLEDELGALLFERIPTGMRLADAGRAFLEHARKILSAVDDARASVTGAVGVG